MKKISTLLALLLMVSIGANAQKYRKTWDFRNGFSAATIAALQADMEQNGATGGESHWRDYEKDAALTVEVKVLSGQPIMVYPAMRMVLLPLPLTAYLLLSLNWKD